MTRLEQISELSNPWARITPDGRPIPRRALLDLLDAIWRLAGKKTETPRLRQYRIRIKGIKQR
jgi:hypothetical protein